ncbi:MAG: endolytic transglycosylase MltG [bacterium]|nr:endolytic transglycosylase MltG [bacterium]
MFERLVVVVGTALHFHALRFWREYVILAFALFAFAFSGYLLLLSPPASFPTGEIIRIAPGSSLPAIASELASHHVIKNRFLFSVLVRIDGGASDLQAGPYRFDAPVNTFTVVRHLIIGESGIPAARVTLPEGFTAREMAKIIHARLPFIREDDFITLATPYEGYLFPDTYFFGGESTSNIVATLRDTFNARIAPLTPLITTSGHSLDDVVTMASLIEREAKTPEDRRTIAGILWNRIKIGMALQVDAVFGYIYGKSAYAPTLDDLKIDSPYNTYTHQGLPPTPIGNPGLDAIEAAANPPKTAYLYYLTGIDGKMRYAKTFAEHQTNREKYLK